MNRQAAEAEAGRLLARREELKRLGLELPPDLKQRLKSLLIALGWTTEAMKLNRREQVIRRLARAAGVKRYERGSTPDEMFETVGRAMDNPGYEAAYHDASDVIEKHHPDEPALAAFRKWLNGEEWSTSGLLNALHPRTSGSVYTMVGPAQTYEALSAEPDLAHEIRPIGGGGLTESARHFDMKIPVPMFGRNRTGNLWHPRKWAGQRYPLHTRPDLRAKKRSYTSEEVARAIYAKDGPKGLIHMIVGSHHWAPHKNFAENGDVIPREGVPHIKNSRRRDETVKRYKLIVPEEQKQSHLAFARQGSRQRYAKADSRHVAHPLVEGFPIETALRHLANDPANHEHIRELAKVALTGGKDRDPANVSMALWNLHDTLHEHKHPAKDWYNWMSAGDKVGLDAHTYRALAEAAERMRSLPIHAPYHGETDTNALPWNLRPEGAATRYQGAMRSDNDPTESPEVVAIRTRTKELSPQSSDSDIEESLLRHAFRSRKKWGLMMNAPGSEDTGHALRPALGHKSGLKWLTEQEKATRYRRLLRRMARNSSNLAELRRYEMVAGDFIDALRRIRSEQQKGIRHTVETIAARIGAKPASTVDALADGPHYSVPGVAQAIYANTAPEKIHALAAWAGLTGNIPGMAVFHYRPDGPDLIHRFRMAGSGQELRMKLDKAGIQNRVLVPHRTGFDVLVPDQQGSLSEAVKNFTTQQKTQLQTSRGHFKTIGSADQAKAREMFRNAITKQEQTPVKERPTLRNRIKGMMIRMARPFRDIDREVQEASKAVDTNPDHEHLRHNLADLLEELPDPEEDWATEVHYPNRKKLIENLRDPSKRVGAFQVVRDAIGIGGEGPLLHHNEGYPVYYPTADGAALCHNCVNRNIRRVADEIKNPDRHNQFQVVGQATNWENNDLTCDHCGNNIESAYYE